MEQHQQQQQAAVHHRHLSCHDCGLVFDSSKSLDVHLHYHKENLVTKWGSAATSSSNGEDNNNVSRKSRQQQQQQQQTTADSTAGTTPEQFQFFDYSENNSAFQRIGRSGGYHRYQPYAFDRSPLVTSSQQEKCFMSSDPGGLVDHDAPPPFFEFKDEPQQEILDLDSQKVVPYQPQGEENLWLDRRYFKEENGNRSSPDFASVSTTMSSPEAVPSSYFDPPPQVMQLSSSQLPKYPPLAQKGSGGGVWKSNEARRPKTYNCSACNKWFTSSGHLKRHYNTTLHKNAVKQSGSMDPAALPVSSSHHHQAPSHQEDKYQYQPQPPHQEDFQDFFQYPNGLPPHTTSFTSDPLPSFSQFQSSLNSGFPSVGGLLAPAPPPPQPQQHIVDIQPEIQQQPPPPPPQRLPPAEESGSEAVSSSEQPVVHKCVDCDKTFNKACYLTQHNKSFHSGDKPYKCQRCGKRFTQEYLHLEHLSKHAGEKPYKCEMCPKQFNHKTDLRRHMCLHSGDKPYACDFCGKGFIRKDHMLKHAETHKKKSLSSSYKKMELDPRLHLRVM